MSMIMRVARGTARDLERLAENGGDDGSGPQGLQPLLSGNLAALSNLTPEMRERLLAVLEAQPQLSAMMPQVLERLRRGFTVVPPSTQAAVNGGGRGQRTASAVSQPETIDLHKSWHIFHFLFTGQAAGGGTPPASFLLEGGREVGEDMGYGPSRLLDVAETEAFARFTESLTVEDLTRRIDAPRMAALGIYCAGEGSGADAEEMTDDVALYFPQLQAHFRAAAQAGQATLVWLT